MPAAGAYRVRYQWQRNGLADPDGAGQKARDYEAGGFLWGTDAELMDAGEDERGGGKRQRTTATIRVRNHPAVRPRDVLYSAEWDETWKVMTVQRGDNEMLLGVERYGA
jgi:hypothetical protein